MSLTTEAAPRSTFSPGRARSVLISGAGIAGTALAYWLDRFGFKPTLVERAPRPRDSGYMIDFWGMGFDVAERMGLLPQLLDRGYRIAKMRFVDRSGKQIAGFDTKAITEPLKGRFISIPRGELARLLLGSIEGRVETLYGDSVAAMETHAEGVSLRLASGQSRDFDLVVGAGGLHSQVRTLTFGPESAFEKDLHFGVAAFNAEDYPHRDDDAYVCYCVPGRHLARYSLRDGRTGFLFLWRRQGDHPLANGGRAAQEGCLREVFGGIGWESDEILAAMPNAPDLYFDAVKQIFMPRWSRNRIAVIGDAAFCPSLLAGEGSSLAVASAYVLAGELAKAKGVFSTAFAAYEMRLKGLITAKQRSAPRMGGWFVPKTRPGLWFRNQFVRTLNLPLVSSLLLFSSMGRELRLPTY